MTDRATRARERATIWPVCGWCGTELEKFGQTGAGRCPKCGAMEFPKDAQPGEKP